MVVVAWPRAHHHCLCHLAMVVAQSRASCYCHLTVTVAWPGECCCCCWGSQYHVAAWAPCHCCWAVLRFPLFLSFPSSLQVSLFGSHLTHLCLLRMFLDLLLFSLLTQHLFYNFSSCSFTCITNIFYNILLPFTLFPWLHHGLQAWLYKPLK